MANRVDSITQNVKGETENMKHKFNNLEQTMRDLSSGNLFGQIDSMIKELTYLKELNEKYELRHFLSSVELERRGLMVDDCIRSIQGLEENLRIRESSLKESERLREEETFKLKRQIEIEVESTKTIAINEKQRLERRIQELQAELSRRDSIIDELNRSLLANQDMVVKLRGELQASYGKQIDQQKLNDSQLASLKNDHSTEMRQMEAHYQSEIETMRKQLEQDKLREVDSQKRLLSDYYQQQLGIKDNELNKMSSAYESMKNKMVELDRENNVLHNDVNQKSKEVNDLREQLVFMKKAHEDYNLKITDSHKVAIQKAIADKEKEMRDKLELELSKLEKELKEKKGIILNLEQKVIFTEKENQRNSARLSDMTVERDELKSKLIDAEKRLNEELRIVEETLTIQVQEGHSEINRLNIQIREMADRFNLQLGQETERANSALIDNDHLRKEIVKLKELSDKRNKEIEEWRIKYKGYITGEE